MGKSYREYSDALRETMSVEAEGAREVFHTTFTVAMAILGARKRLGVSQDQVAAATGIDQGDISRIENGQMLPTVPTLEKLAGALGGRLELRFDTGEVVILATEPEAARDAIRRLSPGKAPRTAPTSLPDSLAAFHR